MRAAGTMSDDLAAGAAWTTYLERFHRERSGITEALLGRCRTGSSTPYEWCAEALLSRPGPVLDIACGSAPLEPLLPRWVGMDLSTGELHGAMARGRGPLLRATADALPVYSGSAGSAVCSMALQILPAPEKTLRELARAVRPGGRIAFLLPATGPMPVRDGLLYLALQVVLRQRIRYPNDALLVPARLEQMARRTDLRVLSDERRLFRLPVDSAADVDLVMRSLYLPGDAGSRLEGARRLLGWAIGHELAVPLRRIVLERTSPQPDPGPDREDAT